MVDPLGVVYPLDPCQLFRVHISLGLDELRQACLQPAYPAHPAHQGWGAAQALRSPLCHAESGYSLHAAVCIDGTDRAGLEHLCPYVARPPLAQGRLQLQGDGKVIWHLRRPWRDGTQAFVFDPLTFFGRLAALVPHP